MSADNFIAASRLKLRFASNRGHLSVEDLWDLSLTSLDTMARAVNKTLKEQAEESFIPKKNQPRGRSGDALRLEILKFIINAKVEENETAKTRAEKQAKLARLKELLLHKQDEQFEALSEEEIRKQIGELEDTDN
jgi:hypothetical protein